MRSIIIFLLLISCSDLKEDIFQVNKLNDTSYYVCYNSKYNATFSEAYGMFLQKAQDYAKQENLIIIDIKNDYVETQHIFYETWIYILCGPMIVQAGGDSGN